MTKACSWSAGPRTIAAAVVLHRGRVVLQRRGSAVGLITCPAQGSDTVHRLLEAVRAATGAEAQVERLLGVFPAEGTGSVLAYAVRAGPALAPPVPEEVVELSIEGLDLDDLLHATAERVPDRGAA